jgi:hypothetical protein
MTATPSEVGAAADFLRRKRRRWPPLDASGGGSQRRGGGSSSDNLIFMLLCTRILMSASIGFYDTLLVHGFPSGYCMFIIFLFTFYVNVCWFYALSCFLIQCVYWVIYVICKYLRHTHLRNEIEIQEKKGNRSKK